MAINVMKGNVYIENYVEPGASVEHKYYGPVYKSGEAVDTVVGDDVEDGGDNTMVSELMPIFMNVRSEVVAFVSAIDGQKPTAVTEKVNELVSGGKITKAGRKGDLHGILNRYGLYKPGVETWNKQVN